MNKQMNKLGEIMRFPARMHLGGGFFPSFADGGPRSRLAVDEHEAQDAEEAKKKAAQAAKEAAEKAEATERARKAVAEVLLLDDELREMIVTKEPVRRVKRRGGVLPGPVAVE